MDKEFKYDAFISYRHCDLDKFVAENLHKVLETYELPKNVKEKLGITGRTIKRVFRDQDELPLSSNLEDPIVDALNNSKYLIVICSPRLKDSMWCKKEIETFKKVRGRKNIFCVLIEGEPVDSFPEEVCFDEVETKDKNGKKKTERIPVEPLAADVRGENKKEVLKKIKEEKLRLIAPMYNLDYDDLKQRHKLRKMHQMIVTSVCVTAFCLLFAIYSTFMFLKINSQQKKLKLNQALNLAKESVNKLNNDSRTAAVKKAYQSLTKYNGVKMPYTSDAEYALTEALGVYDVGITNKAAGEYKTKGVVDFIKSSPNHKYALVYDESEELTLIDSNKLKKINTYGNINGFLFNKESFTFIGDSKIAYIDNDGSVLVYDIKSGKKVKEVKKDKVSFISINSDYNGKYLILNNSYKTYIYDTDKFNKLGEFDASGQAISSEMRFTDDAKYVFVGTNKDSIILGEDDNITMHVLNTSNLKEEDKFSINAKYISDIVDNGKGNIFVLSNQSYKNYMSMEVYSYSYKNKKVNWHKSFEDIWGKYIQLSLYDEVSNLALVNTSNVRVLSQEDGSFISSFNLKSEAVGILASYTSDLYVAFTKEGNVNFLNLKNGENYINPDLFNLKLKNYNNVVQNEKGYLLTAKNDNRVISYTKHKAKILKEEEKKDNKYITDDSISVNKFDEVKKEYNIEKKNLVDRMLFDNKKKILFVTYKDSTLGIYDAKNKKLIKMINDVTSIEHYFGKDKYGRTYVGNSSNSYILDKDYNKVGHIKSLSKLDSKNNQVIVTYNGINYTLPIYTLDDLLKEAKAYLK